MQDSFRILHVNGTTGAVHTRNHVIRCHATVLTAACMQVADCNLHEKVENRLFARESIMKLIGKHMQAEHKSRMAQGTFVPGYHPAFSSIRQDMPRGIFISPALPQILPARHKSFPAIRFSRLPAIFPAMDAYPTG